MRNVKLWNRRFHLIGLKRVVGKRTCDGSGGPLPVQLAPAFGGDRQNQAKFGGQVLKNSAIAPRQRSRLVLDGVVPAVHCSHTNRAVKYQTRTLARRYGRSEEHTSELQSPDHIVC